MKTIAIALTLVASIVANSLTASAVERNVRFDGAKFFAEQTSRAGY